MSSAMLVLDRRTSVDQPMGELALGLVLLGVAQYFLAGKIQRLLAGALATASSTGAVHSRLRRGLLWCPNPPSFLGARLNCSNDLNDLSTGAAAYSK
jgi:hypothetical protein